MSLNKTHTLADIGEFALLRQVVLPTVGGGTGVSPLGDDCAFVKLPGGQQDLVVTTDVVPRPLAWLLGHHSYRTWGWYAVMVNVSDLAAGGAKPLAITTSIEAPGDMLVNDFKDFFDGMADACQAHGITNVGGNIREAPKFACHGTAIGTVPVGSYLKRSSARPGDILISVGECGLFATAYLKWKKCGFDTLSEDDKMRLIRPKARINEMQMLHSQGLVNAASDSSDGVLGAIWNIAEASKCTIELEMSPEVLPNSLVKIASEFGYDPWNLMFFWGDWQVIASIPANRSNDFWKLAKKHCMPIQHLGHIRKGPPQLIGLRNSFKLPLKLLRNENFTKLSFNKDIETHVDFMLRSQLWE